MSEKGHQPNQVQRVFVLFAIISSLLIGIFLIYWARVHSHLVQDDEISTSFKYWITVMGGVWILLGIVAFLFGRKILNFITILSTVNFFYLLLELVTYLSIVAGIADSRTKILEGSLGVFDQPCAVFDTISGYRWLPKKSRVTKIVRNEIIFDNHFLPNQQGYITSQEFEFSKKDSNTKRYIVFGNSFTGAEFLHTPWPDRVLQLLRAEGNNSIELYSFAVDGGGLFNWHRIFFHEIIPAYEFDGVIFAIWGDNLDRDFFIMHHTDTVVYSQYFDQVPKNMADFKTNYLPDMWWSAEIVPDDKIDRQINRVKQSTGLHFTFEKPDLQFLMKMYDTFHEIQHRMRQNAFEKKYLINKKQKLSNYSIGDIIQKYGEHKFDKLDTMIRYCHAHNKEVIFCAVPYLPGINYNKKGEFYSHQAEIKFLSQYFDVGYFDGFEIYDDLPQQELEECFLKYDLHWSQKGSDNFAREFAKYLMRKEKVKY